MPFFLAFAALAAAPSSPDARFVLEVGGLPVAEIRVAQSSNTYVYESTHFLEEGPAGQRLTFDLTQLAAPPEVLTLLRRPAAGCQTVIEERTQALEELCIVASQNSEVHGTLAHEPFVAHYTAQGQLSDLTVSSAHWVAAPPRRTAQPPTAPNENPFQRGLAIPHGPLRLAPDFPGARWVRQPVRGVAPSGDDAGRLRCLLLARADVERHPKHRLAVGLVIDGTHAFPHAWVVEGDQPLDPSVSPEDPILATRKYLEVPQAQSGRFFLQLFDGTLRLVKR